MKCESYLTSHIFGWTRLQNCDTNGWNVSVLGTYVLYIRIVSHVLRAKSLRDLETSIPANSIN